MAIGRTVGLPTHLVQELNVGTVLINMMMEPTCHRQNFLGRLPRWWLFPKPNIIYKTITRGPISLSGSHHRELTHLLIISKLITDVLISICVVPMFLSPVYSIKMITSCSCKIYCCAHVGGSLKRKYWECMYFMHQSIFNSSNAEATFPPKHMDTKIFENHLNPVVLLFIG